MAATNGAGASAPAYEDDAHYVVDLLKVIDLGDMKIRPSLKNKPVVRGDLLKTFDPAVVRGAVKVS